MFSHSRRDVLTTVAGALLPCPAKVRPAPGGRLLTANESGEAPPGDERLSARAVNRARVPASFLGHAITVNPASDRAAVYLFAIPGGYWNGKQQSLAGHQLMWHVHEGISIATSGSRIAESRRGGTAVVQNG